MATPKKPGRPKGSTQKRKPTAEELAKKVGKIEDVKQIPTNAVHVCMCCGTYATKSDLVKKFYISYSLFHRNIGRAPICKECVVSNSTLKGELVPEMFVEVVRTLDRPFMNTIFEATIDETVKEAQSEFAMADREYVIKKKADSVIGNYMKNISLPQYKEYTWMDGDTRYISKEAKSIMEDLNELGEEISTQGLIYKWGDGYSESDYLYLENRYNALTAMANVEFESDSMMLKQICIKELQIRELQRKKMDDTKQLESLQKLMATANIRPTDIKNANADLLNDSYGKWLNVIEEYEPAEYFADKTLYEDFDGIKKYFINWVLRPLKNLLKGTRDFNIEDGE